MVSPVLRPAADYFLSIVGIPLHGDALYGVEVAAVKKVGRFPAPGRIRLAE